MSLLRRPGVWVAAILLVSYAYYWHGRDWNSASRLMLTYAIVERGSLSIDGLDDQTGDKAKREGHFYSDKMPGLSWLAIVPLVPAKLAFGLADHPLNKPGFAYWPADYFATLGTSGLLTIAAALILMRLAADLGCSPRQSALIALAYGLGTPAFAYATLAYGHQASSFCLIGSFALLWRHGIGPRLLRAFLAGVLAAYASVIELQVGPVSAILGFVVLGQAWGGRRPWLDVLVFGAGAAIPTAALLWYNNACFGSPWKMGYFFHDIERFREVHSSQNPLGIRSPNWSLIAELTIASRRGLLWYAPVMLLLPAGLVVLGIKKHWGLLSVSLATIAAVFLVNLSYPEWTGGWSTGPRFLLPMLPFAMLPIAALVAEWGKPGTILTGLLAALGFGAIFLFQGVGARIPEPIESPLTAAVLPLWRGDRLPGWVFGVRYARNLLGLAFPSFVKGLPDWLAGIQFAPLLAAQAALIVAMVKSIRPHQAAEAPSAKTDAS